MTNPISVLIADDHTMFRNALVRCLESASDIRVTASVANSDDAVTAAAEFKPDVVLLDIEMPGITCFEAVRQIHRLAPDSRAVFLSAYSSDRYIEQAIAVNAWGYLVKTQSESALIGAVRKVANGQPCYSPEICARIVIDQGRIQGLAARSGTRLSTLSERELEVLCYVARGLAEKEISRTMHVSPHTVHNHITSIKRKLDIHDRVELTRYAIREGIAEP